METYQYNAAIQIYGKSGTTFGGAVDMGKKDGKRFINAVRDAFKRLEKLATGRKLVHEISNSGKTLKLFATPHSGGAAAVADPQDIQNNFNRMVRSFRPAYKNFVPIQSSATVSGKRDQFLGDVKAKLRVLGVHANTANSAPELDAILLRAWGNVNTGREALRRMLHRTRQEIDDMCDGNTRIDDDTYFKICFAYYEFLTPGPGCNTCVKVVTKVRDEGQGGAYKPKRGVGVAPEIILGHELIHAWRMMKGRRVVDNGWEEEAMTVGIHPFANLPMTENRLRLEAGYPRRDTYFLPTYSTTLGQALDLDTPPV